MKRPTSVSVISWFLIVSGVVTLLIGWVGMSNPMAQEAMAMNPLPLSAQYVMMFAGLVVTLVCGIGMLKGMNWSR